MDMIDLKIFVIENWSRLPEEELYRRAMELGATRAEVKEVVLNLMVVR